MERHHVFPLHHVFISIFGFTQRSGKNYLALKVIFIVTQKQFRQVEGLDTFLQDLSSQQLWNTHMEWVYQAATERYKLATQNALTVIISIKLENKYQYWTYLWVSIREGCGCCKFWRELLQAVQWKRTFYDIWIIKCSIE